MFKRGIAVLMLTMIFATGFSAAAVTADASVGSIKDRIQSNQNSGNMTQLEEDIDKSTSNLIGSARRIFVTLTVIFGIFLAIAYLRAGFSPETLRETKGKIFAFIVFLVLSFWTEQILGWIFSVFGIDLSQL